MLKSRSFFPPGGWKFYQPQMGWELPNPEHTGFDHAVAAIIKIRTENPRFKLPTDPNAVAAELEEYTEQRLRAQYGKKADQWLIGQPGPYINPMWQPLRERKEAAAAEGSAKVVAGVGLLIEWLGSGLKPVDKAEAERRAVICVDCPKNVDPSLIQKAYGAVADGIHKLMNAKADLKLATSYDERLHTCSVCDCRLTLKVWAQKDHVLKHTPPEVMAALPEPCWIKNYVG